MTGRRAERARFVALGFAVWIGAACAAGCTGPSGVSRGLERRAWDAVLAEATGGGAAAPAAIGLLARLRGPGERALWTVADAAEDPAHRALALDRLASRGDLRAKRRLLALDRPSPNEQAAIARHVDIESTRFVALLTSEHAEVRLAALGRLRGETRAAFLPTVAGMRDDPDGRVRVEAIAIYAAHPGAEPPWPDLFLFRDSPSAFGRVVRRWAVVEPETLTEALLAGLAHGARDAQLEWARRVLAAGPRTVATDVLDAADARLLRAVEGDDADLAAQALVALRTGEARPAVRERLVSLGAGALAPWVKVQRALTMSHHGATDAELLRDFREVAEADGLPAVAALAWLRRVQPSVARPRLVALAEHPEPAVRRAAMRALRGQDAAASLARGLDDSDVRVRLAAAGAILLPPDAP